MKVLPLLAPLAAVTIIALCTTAQSGGQSSALVRLQSASPGAAQVGHVNVAGNIVTSNLGVGMTDPPQVPLDVIGNVRFGGNAPHGLTMFNGATSVLEVGVAGTFGHYSQSAIANDAVIRNNAARSLHLQSGSGVSAITITNANRVGINTSDPESLFHVKGGQAYFDPSSVGGVPTVSLAIGAASTGWNLLGNGGLAGVVQGNPTLYMDARRVGINVANPGPDGLLVDGASTMTGKLTITQGVGGQRRVLIDQGGDYGTAFFSAPDTRSAGYVGPVGGNPGLLYIGMSNTAGSVAIGGIARETPNTVNIFGTTKNFVEVNPDDPRTDIWYASLEGPEAAMYCRGSGTLVNGRATIELPDHFKALAQEGTLTVLLTPNSFDTPGLGFGKKALDGIEVGELNQGKGNFDFDWEVKAVRKRLKDYMVLRPWTERMITGTDPKKAWNDRLRDHEQNMLKQNGNQP